MKSHKFKPLISVQVNQAGFTITEIAVALGVLSFLALVVGSLAKLSVGHETKVSGIQNAIEQRGEIRDTLLKAPKSGAETCLQRMGLTGSEVLNPATDFLIPNPKVNKSRFVNLDKLYLTKITSVGTSGALNIYTAQLVAEQSVKGSVQNEPLQPSVLGLMNVSVDSSGHIVGCNWDQQSSNVADYCEGTTGLETDTGAGGLVCNNEPAVVNLGACPGGTTLDLVANHCVPSNVDCYHKALPHNFDGLTLACDYLPPDYAVQYPSGYVPPTPPPTDEPDRMPASTPIPALPVPKTCACGNDTMTAGDGKLCVFAHSKCENPICSATDDMFDVKICNSAGQLEPANPAHYYEEYGNRTRWNWRIATCHKQGGYKNEDGIRYVKGRCY